MTRQPRTHARGTGLARRALTVFTGLVAVYGMMALDGNGGGRGGLFLISAASAELSKFNRGAMATFVLKKDRKKLPAVTFLDAQGKQRSLKDWQGKVVLLNLWATWCAPCRKEMPALDNLNKTFGGKDFELLAISIDRKGAAAAQGFLDEIKVKTLKLYIDKTAKVARTLRAFGLPYTFLIDREGREIGRLVGPAEWDSEEAAALIRAAIEGKV